MEIRRLTKTGKIIATAEKTSVYLRFVHICVITQIGN